MLLPAPDRLHVSAFILIVSVGSAACLLTVENVTGGCLETAAIVGTRGQALEGLKEPVLMDEGPVVVGWSV